MNKLSKYVHLIDNDSNVILYHLIGDKIIALQSDLVDLVFSDNDDFMEELELKHPDLFSQMQGMGMIVPDNKDEAQELLTEWEKKDSDSTYFGIIINPTLDCNLRCWYCYEDHRAGTLMKEEVLTSIFHLIDRKVEEPELKELNISFFGGEPLMVFRTVVLPLLEYGSVRCVEKNIGFSSNFTTNGVLLTDEVVHALQKMQFCKPITFQITLDGNRESHDAVRFTHGNKPTYDLIVKHIHAALFANFKVGVRFNYTINNIDTFVDVIKEFRDLPKVLKKNIRFNFQQVWQDRESSSEVLEKTTEISDLFKDDGLEVDYDNSFRRQNCYADTLNCIVLNYNGDLFKCTARDFKTEIREGVLHPDGILEWNERFYQRMSVKYANTDCRNCSILPICNGGCSQSKLEKIEKVHCYRGLTDKEKGDLIVKRLMYVLSQQNNQRT